MSTSKKEGTLIKNRYRIIYEIPGGGQGNIYLVKDEESNPPSLYVIKQLNRQDNNRWNTQGTEKAIQRFEQEAKILKQLTENQVPQIPHYQDDFKEDQELYLVQEFIQGSTLSKVLGEKKLNEFQVIAFLQDVLGILKRIHESGKSHRDIKPSNLMWQEDKGHMIIIDFGSLKDQNLPKKHRLTDTGDERIPRTLRYSAPELSPTNAKKWQVTPDHKVDIYSLGRTAIEALMGDSILDYQHISLERIKDEVTDKLAVILYKMTKEDPRERYQSAQEVLEELESFNLVGSVLQNRYKIINFVNYLNQEKLNIQAVDHTYIAIDDQYQREVVIREFSPGSNEEHVLTKAGEIFAEECSKLDHIRRLGIAMPRLLDHFTQASKFYLVYETISGRYLSQDLVCNQKLNQNWGEERVINFLKKILPTLESIHNSNYIHLDIKPSKILTTDTSTVYLTEAVGVERIANLSSNSYGGIEMPLVGTVDYMPPEQEGRDYDHQNSDLYSLGITLIQFLTGKSPQEIKRDKGNNLWSKDIKVQTGLKNILEKMVDEEYIQGKRYQSAGEVINDLNHLAEPSKAPSLIDKIKNVNIFVKIIVPILFLVLTYFSWRFVSYVQAVFKYRQISEIIVQAEGEESEIIANSKYSIAFEGLTELLEQKPDLYQALVSRGYVMGKLDPKRYRADITKDCQKALEYQDKFAGAYNCLGLAHYESGKNSAGQYRNSKEEKYKSQAIGEFNRAIQQYNKVIQFDDPKKYKFNDGMTTYIAWFNQGEAYKELSLLATAPEDQSDYCDQAKIAYKESKNTFEALKITYDTPEEYNQKKQEFDAQVDEKIRDIPDCPPQ